MQFIFCRAKETKVNAINAKRQLNVNYNAILFFCRARETKVNAVNAKRQLNVNYYAESVGASSGTAKRDGVPGTVYGVTGKGYYPAPHPHYAAHYPAYPAGYYPDAHYYPAGYHY